MSTDLLIDLLVKSTVVLGAAWGATLLMRRAAAATRHLVWTLALVGILALPALSWLPGWRLPMTAPWSETSNADGGATPAQPIVLAAFVPPEKSGKPVQAAEDAVRGPSLPASDKVQPNQPQDPAATTIPTQAAAPVWLGLETRLLMVWAIGAVFSLLAIALALLRLHRLASRCIETPTQHIRELAATLTQEFGLRRRVRLLTTNERTIPMTWGILRPTLLLPYEAAEWSPERLRMVMLHELAHIARWDCLTHLLGHLARCIYWFHPLAWWTLAQQRREQEKACDDTVVCHGAQAEDYAEHLLAVTAQLPVGYFASSLALGMGRSSRLGDRLTALLDASRRHRPTSSTMRWAISALALCLCVSTTTARWAPKPGAPDDPAVIPVAQEQPMTPDSLKKLEDIRKKLRDHYVGPLDDKALIDAAIKGLLQGLKDPYTDYLPADEFDALTTQLKGSFVGIGAQLKMVGDRLTVLTPLDNSPALKAGLRAGDIIEAIDGNATRGVEMAQSIKRILGETGTVVKLKIVRESGAVEDVSITRAPIRVATVHGFQRGAGGAWRYLLDGEHKVGYLRITQFGPGTAAETRTAALALQKDGLKGLILDLRFCPGGLLDQALGVCKLFVKDGLLLTVKGAGKTENKYEADGKDTLGDFPLVILVNEQTASAGEIVAGVLRDRKHALVLGSRTFGKGSIQQIVNLDGGAALRVTSAYHYLPSGRMIDKRAGEKSWGVDPDDGYYLPLTKAQTDALQKNQMDRFALGRKKDDPPAARMTPKLIEEQYADPQLAAATRTLVAKLTGGEFIKVGQSTAKMAEHMQHVEQLRQKREALLQDLQRLERDIDAATQKK